MFKILTLFMFLVIAYNSYSQDKISTYKTVADKKIASYFDSSLLKKIECSDFSITDLDSTRSWYKYYGPNKNVRLRFLTVTFSYSFFSKKINHFFSFDISVDKNKLIKADSDLFSEIPECISKNFECGFIKKDSAIKVALADSIKYPNNLEIEFIKPYNRKEYYWFITGRPKQQPSKGIRKTTTRTVSPKQRKIINALTGQIVPWHDFTNPN